MELPPVVLKILAVSIGLIMVTGVFIPILLESMPISQNYDRYVSPISSIGITADPDGIYYDGETYEPEDFFIYSDGTMPIISFHYHNRAWNVMYARDSAHAIAVELTDDVLTITQDGGNPITQRADQWYISAPWSEKSDGYAINPTSPTYVPSSGSALIVTQNSTSHISILHGELTGSLAGVSVTERDTGGFDIRFTDGVIVIIEIDDGGSDMWWKLLSILPITLLIFLLLTLFRGQILKI